ncbi:MAG: glycoside hydrolase family 10 protein [Acidimicrobiales bacterium]
MSAIRWLLRSLVVAAVLTACSGAGDGDASGPGNGSELTTTAPPAADTTTTSSSTTTVPRSTGPPESSVWVHLFDETLKTPAGVETMLDEVEAAGIDAVIAQVARRHDAYYDSAYLPPTPDPALEPGFDVLEALVDGGHERGLQIHAWFVVAPTYHEEYDELTLPPGHVWLDHGPDSEDPWTTVAEDGTGSEYLDVGLPVVHDHVAAIVEDIAGRYPVDGVHLDYVRYDDDHWGYHPRALDLFRLDTGRTGRPAPDDPDWVAWRTERTAALIERAATTLDTVRPEALLSAAVIAGGEGPAAAPEGFAGTRAASRMFQDWPRWLDDDRLDFVVAMAYAREAVPEQAEWFRQWVDFAGSLAERHPGRVAVGVGAYLNSVDDALTQVELAREATGHLAVYSYQQDSADGPRGAVLDRCCPR